MTTPTVPITEADLTRPFDPITPLVCEAYLDADRGPGRIFTVVETPVDRTVTGDRMVFGYGVTPGGRLRVADVATIHVDGHGRRWTGEQTYLDERTPTVLVIRAERCASLAHVRKTPYGGYEVRPVGSSTTAAPIGYVERVGGDAPFWCAERTDGTIADGTFRRLDDAAAWVTGGNDDDGCDR